MSRLTEKIQEHVESLTDKQADDLTCELMAEHLGVPSLPAVRFLKMKRKAINLKRMKKLKVKRDGIKTILDDTKALQEIQKIYPDAYVVDNNNDDIVIRLTKKVEVTE